MNRLTIATIFSLITMPALADMSCTLTTTNEITGESHNARHITLSDRHSKGDYDGNKYYEWDEKAGNVSVIYYPKRNYGSYNLRRSYSGDLLVMGRIENCSRA